MFNLFSSFYELLTIFVLQADKFGKLNKRINFPEILNMAPYMSGTSDKSPIYQLYGVVVHLDVMNATFTGHYVSYIKNNQGRWFKADDSTVCPSLLLLNIFHCPTSKYLLGVQCFTPIEIFYFSLGGTDSSMI